MAGDHLPPAFHCVLRPLLAPAALGPPLRKQAGEGSLQQGARCPGEGVSGVRRGWGAALSSSVVLAQMHRPGPWGKLWVQPVQSQPVLRQGASLRCAPSVSHWLSAVWWRHEEAGVSHWHGPGGPGSSFPRGNHREGASTGCVWPARWVGGWLGGAGVPTSVCIPHMLLPLLVTGTVCLGGLQRVVSGDCRGREGTLGVMETPCTGMLVL